MRNEPQPNPVVEPVRQIDGILYKGNSGDCVTCFSIYDRPGTFQQANGSLTAGRAVNGFFVHKLTLPLK